MPNIFNSRFVLAVRNLEVSTKYYMDVLGFRKDPIDAAGWSLLTRDCVRLMLGECSGAQPAGELVSSAPADKPCGLREFGMRTPDGHRIVCGSDCGVAPAILTCQRGSPAEIRIRLRSQLG